MASLQGWPANVLYFFSFGGLRASRQLLKNAGHDFPRDIYYWATEKTGKTVTTQIINNIIGDHCSILGLSVSVLTGDFQSRNFGSYLVHVPDTGNLHLGSENTEKYILDTAYYKRVSSAKYINMSIFE